MLYWTILILVANVVTLIWPWHLILSIGTQEAKLESTSLGGGGTQHSYKDSMFVSCEVMGYYFILGCISRIIIVVIFSRHSGVSLSCIFVIKVSKNTGPIRQHFRYLWAP
jgi:hypothetical protein